MKPTSSTNKRQILESLLEQGMVLIALDARVEGVVVPPHLYHDPQLRLNISYRFGLPMTLDPTGIKATLTFSGTSFQCEIPWPAIFLAVSHVSGEPYLFTEDIPSQQMATAGAQEDSNRTAPGKSTPQLTLVPDPEESSTESDLEVVATSSQPQRLPPQPVSQSQATHAQETEPPPNTPKPSRGHLRLVK